LAREYPNIDCAICDVSDWEQVKSAINEFAEKHKVIDVLVNNAGYIFSSPLIGSERQD